MIGPNYPVSLKIVKLDYKLLFNCPPPRVKSVAIWVASIINIGSRAIFRSRHQHLHHHDFLVSGRVIAFVKPIIPGDNCKLKYFLL